MAACRRVLHGSHSRYDGPAFQAIERRRALEREKNTWRGQSEPTRLVPVDAAPDFETLRARYPTNHLIVRAVIALSYLGPSERGPLIYGTVREIVPADRRRAPRDARHAERVADAAVDRSAMARTRSRRRGMSRKSRPGHSGSCISGRSNGWESRSRQLSILSCQSKGPRLALELRVLCDWPLTTDN